MPSLLDRKFWGERESSARVTSGAELLFCRRSAYGAFDGYYILLRAPGTSEQILWKESRVTSVSRRYWERIAREIARNNCVSTRLIQQRVTAEGTEETDWTAQSARAPRKNLRFLIGLAFFPWMGIIARLLTRDVRLIALIRGSSLAASIFRIPVHLQHLAAIEGRGWFWHRNVGVDSYICGLLRGHRSGDRCHSESSLFAANPDLNGDRVRNSWRR